MKKIVILLICCLIGMDLHAELTMQEAKSLTPIQYKREKNKYLLIYREASKEKLENRKEKLEDVYKDMKKRGYNTDTVLLELDAVNYYLKKK